jgi:glycosyltransferase involved in cell wall biosynthesis
VCPELLIVVISWNRPRFLRRTLDSLFAQTTPESAAIFLVDNGSGQQTLDVIHSEPRLRGFELLDRNYGLNVALETAVPRINPGYSYLLVSDADMLYREPITDFLRFFQHPAVEAISLHHSPEHPVAETTDWQGISIMLKRTERGCSLLFPWERFQSLRPLPIHQVRDFDWWACRDAPNPVRSIAVFPSALHLGWRKGHSTWNPNQIPEYEYV